MQVSDDVLLSDKALVRLCLDDGRTFVTSKGEILTCSVDAPKLDAIRDYVQTNQSLCNARFWGEVPILSRVAEDRVETMMEIMAQALSLTDNETEKSKMEQFLTSLCQAGVNARASDIHIEIHRSETRFLLRVDGVREILLTFASGESALRQQRDVGIRLAAYIFNKRGRSDFSERDPNDDSFAIELMTSELSTSETDGEPDDQKVPSASTILSKIIEWRVALMPLDRGIKLTLRCLTPLGAPLTLAAMDLPAPYIEQLVYAVSRRGGGIFITGPMGSGKSSMIYALLENVDRVARSVHALEDPVEFEQEGVCKTSVEPAKETKSGSGKYRDYAFYAKEQLRHDIDVAPFGEIRDYAAAKEFCRKAETGGLAITTLHTNSALGVPSTMIEQLNIPAAVVSAPGLMLLFTHQKLVRRLCECALSLDQAKDIYDEAGLADVFEDKQNKLRTLVPDHLDTVRVKHPKGCVHCQDKGEKGRVLVMEMIVLEDGDREFIRRQDYLGWKNYLNQNGWPDIRQHTLHRIRRGQVDILSVSEQIDGLMPRHADAIYRRMADALS
ncbi:type II secretion protein [Photobacterium frigidiphilum]|uniref:Type II secretion protein n=1 Tax=Photobacterium frigidiphilum TaxID=264736 RepID=A0A2T3JAA0_9GAMM|nr:ATPase, T2SS/T4P/T4SS family [Photobacterium frigidiphilum]PSU45769.1 type II secretion protein [Photobacterium frigidiphilum]